MYSWHVFLVDGRAGGQGIQDVTNYISLPDSTFGGDARSDKDVRQVLFKIPVGVPNVAIDSLMELWAGYFDVGSQTWDPTRVPYAGFILDHKGSAPEGAEHIIVAQLVGYSDLGDTTVLDSWPVLDPNTTQVGIRPGFTVNEWLRGPVQGFVGLVPAYLTDAQLLIDARIGQIVLTAANIPGIIQADLLASDPVGFFGFVYIADAIIEILKAAQAADDTVRPFVFWRATPVGATLVPQIVIVDLNTNPGGVICTVSNDGRPGTIRARSDFEHQRDARKTTPQVVVKGLFADTTTMGNPLVYFRHSVPAHLAQYPDTHRRQPGRTLLVNERTLATVAEALRYAQRLETQVWAPRGTLSFTLEDADLATLGLSIDALKVGAWLHYIDDMETLDREYPIVGVKTKETPEERSAYVTVGFLPLDAKDVRVGGTADMPWLRNGGPGGSGPGAQEGRGGAVGVPVVASTHTTPVRTAQNIITTVTKAVTALTLKATARVMPGQDPLTIPQAHIFEAYAPAALTPATHISGLDGRPHPQVYALGFNAAGTTRRYINHWDTDFAVLRTKGTGYVTLNKNGVAVAGPYSGDGAHTFDGIHYVPSDDWSITVTGVVGEFSVTVSE